MDPSRKRQGGRGRRTEGSRVPQLPWTEVANPYPPMEVLSADQLEAIHLTSLRILEELGMEVMSSRALQILQKAGAEVDSATRTVRLDRAWSRAHWQAHRLRSPSRRAMPADA